MKPLQVLVAEDELDRLERWSKTRGKVLDQRAQPRGELRRHCGRFACREREAERADRTRKGRRGRVGLRGVTEPRPRHEPRPPGDLRS